MEVSACPSMITDFDWSGSCASQRLKATFYLSAIWEGIQDTHIFLSYLTSFVSVSRVIYKVAV